MQKELMNTGKNATIKQVFLDCFIRLSVVCFALLYFNPLFAQVTPVVYPSKFTVAKDGSGDFTTIQEAVNAVRDLSQQQVTILIKKGIYQEKITIPTWKTNISLVGQDKEGTVITNSDYSGKMYSSSRDAFGKDKFSTYNSYTMLVQGDNCVLKNLTIKNEAGRVGQAVALHVEGDKVAVYNCNLIGNQDTLYAGTASSRQYYSNCYIEGTTDFIFGQATVVFQSCTIKSLQNSYLTAAATSGAQQYGFVFFDCSLIADTAIKKVYLGRPWRPHAQTVFIRTQMGEHIRSEGWDNWRNPENEKTVFYAEYLSKGAGANANGRVKWSKQLTAKQARQYKTKNILAGLDCWNPQLTAIK